MQVLGLLALTTLWDEEPVEESIETLSAGLIGQEEKREEKSEVTDLAMQFEMLTIEDRGPKILNITFCTWKENPKFLSSIAHNLLSMADNKKQREQIVKREMRDNHGKIFTVESALIVPLTSTLASSLRSILNLSSASNTRPQYKEYMLNVPLDFITGLFRYFSPEHLCISSDQMLENVGISLKVNPLDFEHLKILKLSGRMRSTEWLTFIDAPHLERLAVYASEGLQLKGLSKVPFQKLTHLTLSDNKIPSSAHLDLSRMDMKRKMNLFLLETDPKRESFQLNTVISSTMVKYKHSPKVTLNKPTGLLAGTVESKMPAPQKLMEQFLQKRGMRKD